MTKKTKRIIGIIIVIVVLAAGAVSAYFIFGSKETEKTVETEVALSETPNLGACSLVNTETIKSLERVDGGIKSISEGTRVGLKSPDGTNADACRYTFTTNASTTNTLTIAAYNAVARTDTNPATSGDYSWSQAANTSPQIYFAETKAKNDSEIVYIARQPLGGVVLLATMNQPADATTFPKGAGVWILADILGTVNVATLNEKNAQELNSGDAPGPPPATTKAETLKPTE